LQLEGEINSEGILNIAGLVDGAVNSAILRILDTGSIKGNLKANKIEIDGEVQGNIQAETIYLGRNAIVKGDIYFSETLKTEEGADVDGYIKKTKRSSQKNQIGDNASETRFGKPVLVKKKKKQFNLSQSLFF
jgi:cytoskeletal protein CcmA (bactofilin family)